MKILMVCLGNICRSPLAEGIMRKKLEDNHIEGEVDSCGFESFHDGDNPDRRSVQVAKKHNIDITSHRGKMFKPSFFDYFDLIYVMDSNNYSDVASVARNSNDMEKVDYIMNMVKPGSNIPVPDPYYGGPDGFEKTYEMLDIATDKIVETIKKRK
ncbi:MAG: protein-tyrosine-phosphatase [Bacteroidetes bacterium HGW-Bacteroidetes-9]|jgi:protein-tyrosine phosphatase|nr:MAG: protein-tyrosine-phosphatase [Bacteroidetes bacterium HGW-Bacteroidetes-9]